MASIFKPPGGHLSCAAVFANSLREAVGYQGLEIPDFVENSEKSAIATTHTFGRRISRGQGISMCAEETFAGRPNLTFDRRQFALMTGSAALLACTGMEDEAGDNSASAGSSLIENTVLIDTEDGELDAFFVHPAAGQHPGIILWPDIAGLRDAKRMMARRLSEQGYAVLVVNPYYRDVAGEQFATMREFRAGGGFQTVAPWRDKLSSDAIIRDARTLVDWLDNQEVVDSGRGIGSQGYCMGGPFTVYTASAQPDRVAAAASFHGGGLVRDDAASPHRLMRETANTEYLIAIAQDDDAQAPDDKTALRKSAEEAGIEAEVEIYSGDHGWCVPDNPSYDETAAERAWSRLLALYQGALT